MISAANNYFTLKSTIPFESFRRFTSEEDPFNVLNNFATASKEDLVRIDDNDIQMFKKVITHDRSGLM